MSSPKTLRVCGDLKTRPKFVGSDSWGQFFCQLSEIEREDQEEVLVLVLHRGAVTVSSTGAENQIQVDDNGHVGRPCEVSLAPPCPELFCELRGLYRHSYFGPRTFGGSETNVIEVSGVSIQFEHDLHEFIAICPV